METAVMWCRWPSICCYLCNCRLDAVMSVWALNMHGCIACAHTHTHTPKFLTAVKCNTHTQTQTHTHCDKSVSYSTSCSPHCCCVFLVARIHTHWRSSSPLVTHILFVPVRWHSVTNWHAPNMHLSTHTHTHIMGPWYQENQLYHSCFYLPEEHSLHVSVKCKL